MLIFLALLDLPGAVLDGVVVDVAVPPGLSQQSDDALVRLLGVLDELPGHQTIVDLPDGQAHRTILADDVLDVRDDIIIPHRRSPPAGAFRRSFSLASNAL